MEKIPPPRQEVQIETVLLAVHSVAVNLAPVPEEDDDTLQEAVVEERDAGAATPVPRERSPGHPRFDPLTKYYSSYSGPRISANGKGTH